MSWKDALAYGRGIVGKHDEDTRADHGLPLGARVGCVLKWQMTPFIRAGASGSLVPTPVTTDAVVVAASQVRVDAPGKLHRLYLRTDDDSDGQQYLQIYTDADGSVTDMTFYTRLVRYYPETEEEQDAFFGQEGYGLGELNYAFDRAWLLDGGVPEPLVAAAFNDGEQLTYQRDVAPHEAFFAPFVGTETRVDDAEGIHGLEKKVYFMPYARALGDDHEFLLISTEVIKSRDGQSARGVHVDFVVGLRMDADRITVQ